MRVETKVGFAIIVHAAIFVFALVFWFMIAQVVMTIKTLLPLRMSRMLGLPALMIWKGMVTTNVHHGWFVNPKKILL